MPDDDDTQAIADDADELAKDVETLERLLSKRRMAMDAWIAWTNDEILAADHLTNLFPQETLGNRAYAAANLLVTKILAGEVEIKGRELAPVLRAVFDIARLESNQPTEVRAEMNAKERREFVNELRERIKDRFELEGPPIVDAEIEDA